MSVYRSVLTLHRILFITAADAFFELYRNTLIQTEWHDVLVDDATAVEVWNGVKRSYWNLPVYRMPVASYSM
jgi:hypothetical protein